MSALQHFRAPEGLAPGPGFSHAVTGRGRWVATVQVSALAMPGLEIEIEAYAICAE